MSTFIPRVNAGEEPQLIDSSTEDVTYVGYPAKEAAEAQAKWAIKKISVVDGIMKIQWAGGNLEKNKIWNNRAALEYSNI